MLQQVTSAIRDRWFSGYRNIYFPKFVFGFREDSGHQDRDHLIAVAVTSKFMKTRIYIVILLFSTLTATSQNAFPFFEEKALEFYTDTILKEDPKKVRLEINPDLIKNNNILFNPENSCFDLEIANDSLFLLPYEIYNKDNVYVVLNKAHINKKKFKIVREVSLQLPHLVISYPRRYKDVVFIRIQEFTKPEVRNFDLKFDLNGKVIMWCKSEGIIISSH